MNEYAHKYSLKQVALTEWRCPIKQVPLYWIYMQINTPIIHLTIPLSVYIHTITLIIKHEHLLHVYIQSNTPFNKCPYWDSYPILQMSHFDYPSWASIFGLSLSSLVLQWVKTMLEECYLMYCKLIIVLTLHHSTRHLLYTGKYSPPFIFDPFAFGVCSKIDIWANSKQFFL